MSERPPESVDMSPAAIDRRLRRISEILELVGSLRKAKVVGYARDVEKLPHDCVGEAVQGTRPGE